MAKKRPKKRPAPTRTRWFIKLVLGAAILGGALGAVALWRVDAEVVATLQGREQSTVSALLSDTFSVRRGDAVKSSVLRGELLARRYREITGDPTVPGEFTVRGPEFLVYTREFRAADGTIRAPQVTRFIPNRGEIRDIDGRSIPSCTIEPQVLAPLGSDNRRATERRSLAAFPTELRAAVLAIEDQRFYAHLGVDPIGIARAAVENLLALRVVQGGSTLTQQLAKNLLFTPERTLGRKLMEALAAFSLEYRLTKDQIFEMYLNEVYLGQEGAIAIHGFGAAAQSYFGKRVEDLTLAESALLAGLIQAPSAYAPRRNAERALQRRGLVLAAMEGNGAISAEARQTADAEPLHLVAPSYRSRVAPHFSAAVAQELSEGLNLPTAILSGITVHTGIRQEYQRCAEEALQRGLAELEQRYPKLAKGAPLLEGAVVAIEPHSGKITAWVGGRDYARNQFDHVRQAERQIGSTVKPFLYLTALDGGLNSYKVASAVTTLYDEPIEIQTPGGKPWRPENFDEKFRGAVTLREALEHSLNMPAIYTVQRFGVTALAQTLQKFHIAQQPPAVPALALGALDTTLLRLTAAFGAIANGGIYVEPRLFISVLDATGAALATGPIVEQVVSAPGPTFVLTNLLRGVIDTGTGKAIRGLGFQGDAAGKTGTSNEGRDAWFVGFTPDLVAGVWVGFDDNRETGLTGGGAAAPIWGHFMRCLEPHREDLEFLPPRDVIELEVDAQTGLLVTPACPSISSYREYFVRGTQPPSNCEVERPAAPPIAEPPPELDAPWWQRLM